MMIVDRNGKPKIERGTLASAIALSLLKITLMALLGCFSLAKQKKKEEKWKKRKMGRKKYIYI